MQTTSPSEPANSAANANPPAAPLPVPTPTSQMPAEDVVLLSSWASMAAYDQRAFNLKQSFVQRRRQMIFLSLSATCFTSLAALVAALSIALPVSTAFAILGIVLATILTFLRDDVSEFSKTTTWINLRYIAEAMRTELYLYRMHAGRYRNIPNEDADDLLGEAIEKIQADATKNDNGLVAVSDATSIDSQRQLLVARGEIRSDEVIQKGLEFATYKSIRMDGQKDWYDRKIVDDYASHKRRARASRAVLGVGAVVAALGLAGSPQFSVVIAITTALSAAITSDSNVNMFGKTYGIFQTATRELGNLNRVWLAKQNNPDMVNPEKRLEVERDFVELVEQIASTERESWYQMVVNIQTISDGTIVAENPKNNPAPNAR